MQPNAKSAKSRCNCGISNRSRTIIHPLRLLARQLNPLPPRGSRRDGWRNLTTSANTHTDGFTWRRPNWSRSQAPRAPHDGAGDPSQRADALAANSHCTACNRSTTRQNWGFSGAAWPYLQALQSICREIPVLDAPRHPQRLMTELTLV